jgi:predicted metal-dependent hydrolase
MKELIIDATTGETTERELTAEEIAAETERQTKIAWRDLRNHRNNLLAASDWTVLGDSPTPTAAWKAYRQQLRDLPANTVDPFNPVWPTPPS